MILDGNAVAGDLHEVFGREVTAAWSTCAGCGRVDALGAVRAYVRAPGIVLRCPACDGVLLRLVRGGGRTWLDLSGIRLLELRE